MAYDKGGGDVFGSTAIKELLKGMSNYLCWLESTEEKENHFEVGTAIDALICQNHDFDSLVYVCQFDGRSADGKKERQANKDKAIISHDDFKTITAMVAELKRHPIAAKFFDGSYDIRFQQVFEFDYILDNGEVIKLRATPDLTIYQDGVIVGWCDFKSTIKENHDDFTRQFKYLDYDVQAGMYTVIMKNNGAKFDANHPVFNGIGYPVVYIGQSKKTPYSVFITKLNDSVIEQGWLKVEQALKTLSDGREKLKAGEYIGYTGIVEIGGFTQKREALQAINESGDLF